MISPPTLASAVLLAALTGCRETPRPAAAPAPAPAAKPPAYRLEARPPASCAVDVDCVISLHLTALGDYHVNDEYPFKFLLDKAASSAIEPVAQSPFTVTAPTAGAMTYTFRAGAPGPISLSGTLRLSVCNDRECLIKEAPVALALTITAR